MRASWKFVTLSALAALVATAALVVAGGATAAAAAVNVNLDQCANQTTPCSWQNGDLNKNNSAYAEGDVVPFRLAIEGLTAGQHTIHINYDFTAGGNEAYDYLATYNATETVDLCAAGGGGVSSLCPSLPAPSVLAFPSDPFTVTDSGHTLSVPGAETFGGVSRNLTLYGGTIDSIVGPTHDGSTGGNSTGDFLVTFTTTGDAALLAWGGHLAQSAYWFESAGGAADGAGQITGAPWHMRTQQLDLSANKNQDRSIQPSALAPVSAVTFLSASAVRAGHAVVVRWKTASEVDTLGYNVYRLAKGKLVRANKNLILTHGGSYSFVDRKAPAARNLRYRIQAVHTDGSRSWYGPLAVKVNA